MKKTIYQGSASVRLETLFNENAFPEFVETLPGVELVRLSGDHLRHSSTYHIEPQGITLNFYCDKFQCGEVHVELYGKADTFSELEQKLLEENNRRREQYLQSLDPDHIP